MNGGAVTIVFAQPTPSPVSVLFVGQIVIRNFREKFPLAPFPSVSHHQTDSPFGRNAEACTQHIAKLAELLVHTQFSVSMCVRVYVTHAECNSPRDLSRSRATNIHETV